jgi:hypothetical protein
MIADWYNSPHKAGCKTTSTGDIHKEIWREAVAGGRRYQAIVGTEADLSYKTADLTDGMRKRKVSKPVGDSPVIMVQCVWVSVYEAIGV